MSSVALSNTDLLLAALLLAINGGISLAFGLRLERNLLLATARMVVQVAAIGFVLRFVFSQSSPLWTAAVAMLMLLLAGYELMTRQERRFKGWWSYGLGNATLLFASGLAALYAVTVVIAPSPWYAPRYLLPILGMVLGSTLTSVSLVLQTLAEGIERERGAIEARIAQGGTRFAAFGPLLRRAMRTATAPLLNIMSVAGLVALPSVVFCSSAIIATASASTG
jgi:putative ABC transport system permease protein